MLGVVRHQLAAELERVLSGRMRELVDEALDVDRVLVVVDAAPEADRHVRIAHGMVDGHVRHGVAERAEGVVRLLVQALEVQRVHAVLQGLGPHLGQDRLAGDAELEADEVALLVKAPDELGLRDRPVPAVRHVLLAAVDELDRYALHLLGDIDGELDIVLEGAAPAEAAAQVQLVDLALLERQARGCGGRRERALGGLRRAPDLALVVRHLGRGVHRLHARVVEERGRVDSLHLGLGLRDRLVGVAHFLGREHAVLAIETLLEELRDGRARHLGVGAVVPDDRQLVECGLGVPPGVGDDGNGRVVDFEHVLDPRHRLDLVGVEALELAAPDRTLLDGRVEEAGELLRREVDGVDLLAGQLVGGVEPLHRLAGDLPALGILELDVGFLRRLELGGRLRDLAERGRLLRRRVGDDAVGDGALLGLHLPLVGSGLDQHHARRGAALTHVKVRLADAAASARRHVLPHALPGDVLARCRVLPGDLLPVALEFLGHELGEAGQRALAHFRAGDADDSRVVGLDDNPGVDLGRGGRRLLRLGGKGHVETENKAATGGGRGGHEAAAGQSRAANRDLSHGVLPPQAFFWPSTAVLLLPLAARWMAARMRW